MATKELLGCAGCSCIFLVVNVTLPNGGIGAARHGQLQMERSTNTKTIDMGGGKSSCKMGGELDLRQQHGGSEGAEGCGRSDCRSSTTTPPCRVTISAP